MTPSEGKSDLVERLRHADAHSQQRVLGSCIFGEAADHIDVQSATISLLERQVGHLELSNQALSDGLGDEISRLERELAEAHRQEWQPIKTAPRDVPEGGE